MGNPKHDAKGQFAPSQADRKADGVHSAKPTVITGSDDATVHNKSPPSKKKNLKEANKAADCGSPLATYPTSYDASANR